MIYVSSSCSKQKRIGHAIQELAEHGFHNIELSGGTEYYKSYEEDIFELKEEFNLNYLVHNYFPPPREDFVLNLASLDVDTYQKSFQNLQKSIKLTKKVGATKFSFHAGFFIDPNIEEIGKTIRKRSIRDKNLSVKRFCDGFIKLKKAAGLIDLYLENNVYSFSNYRLYKSEAPFMLLHFSDYKELRKLIDFKLLLDLGHLNVSINTLNLNRREEFRNMINSSDYIHISENDGLHDQNKGLTERSSLFKLLKKYDLRKRIITLETYDDIDKVSESYNVLSSVIS